MNFIRHCLAFAVLIFALPALAEDKPAAAGPRPVRQRFVPKPGSAKDGNGADFSALHQMKMDKPGVLMLMAHAGVGDSFPVAEEHHAKVFDVKVVAGDDDMLTLEIQSAAGFESHNLKRDGSVSVQIAGHKFTLSYPSVTVNPDSKPTTDKAMILVNRFP
jgi:hypothetical protein